ncbi:MULTISPECIES: helix-turn-helix transcriptional regulator [unclassified Bradyrhizobium]|uniref:helix-turn-helix transcriptional regulator n=1 Tax=unclassified Bradyrhizobium TaxID=2631580 RepID=UPI0028F090FC|nr:MULTISPECIES: AlpA family phage regulatory protein [unclassified Bradyrhizobium]
MSDTKSKTNPVRPAESPPPPVHNASVPMVEDHARPRRMLSEKQVLGIVPVGRSTLWRMEKAGKFPKATPIGTNRRMWFEDQIVTWQNELTK